MRILLRHPVPARFRPPRSRPGTATHLTLVPLSTPVEIPEVSPGTMAFRNSYHTDGLREFAVHAGRCWETVLVSHLGISGADRPATPAAVAQWLSGPGGGKLRRQGTPLAGRLLAAFGDVTGTAPPDASARKVLTDHTELVRAAAAAYVGDHLATDGTSVYAARPMPVIDPLARNGEGAILHEPPRSFGPAVFEPSRTEAIPPYLAAVGRSDGSGPTRDALARCFGTATPYRDDDLAVFVNDVPRLVSNLSRTLADRLAPDERRTLRARIALLEPHAELGLVGAVPAGSWADVVALARDAAAVLALAAPDPRRRSEATRIVAYADHAALPALRLGALPDEDLADLAALAPGR